MAGEIRVRPRGFALNAIVAAAVTAVATVTVLRVVSPVAATIALAIVMTPYVALAALRREQIEALPIFRMVHLAIPLAARAGIPHRIVGTLILAGLTGLPNAIAALRLARRGRGSAVVSEALNSDTINVAVGICLPGLVLGMGPPPDRRPPCRSGRSPASRRSRSP